MKLKIKTKVVIRFILIYWSCFFILWFLLKKLPEIKQGKINVLLIHGINNGFAKTAINQISKNLNFTINNYNEEKIKNTFNLELVSRYVDKKSTCKYYLSMKKIKLYSINIFLIGILFLILEFLTGNFLFRQKIDCAYLLCNRKFVYNVDFHHNLTNYQIVYQRDMFGFRDREKKLEDIDILTVGGSTTDERFLKDNDTWSKKLEKKLRPT